MGRAALTELAVGGRGRQASPWQVTKGTNAASKLARGPPPSDLPARLPSQTPAGRAAHVSHL